MNERKPLNYSGLMFEKDKNPAVEMNAFGAFGVGVDIVRIERFRDRVDDESYLERLFSLHELRDAGYGHPRASRLAARWAAKEATAKALGCGLGSMLGWREVEVIRDGEGGPHIRLSPAAMERHSHPKLALSLSHDGDYAIAIVLLCGRDRETG